MGWIIAKWIIGLFLISWVIILMISYRAGKRLKREEEENIRSGILTIESELSEIKDRISSIEMNISNRGPEEIMVEKETNRVEEWLATSDEEYLDQLFNEFNPVCERCGKGKEGHKIIAVMGRKCADCISMPIHGEKEE